MHGPFIQLVALAIVVWIGLLWILSVVGGWRTLARKFPSVRSASERMHVCPAAWFEHTGPGYRWMVRVGFSEAGVYVRPLVFVAPFHPAFLVPWTHISRRRSRDWMGENRELILDGDDKGLHLLLSPKAEHDLERLCRSTKGLGEVGGFHSPKHGPE